MTIATKIEPTKRNVLKVLASLFDPLGFRSPITARVKLIFQLLCKDKFGRDELLPEKINIIWSTVLSDLKSLNVVRLQRFVLLQIHENINSIELHSFSDSSNCAYCAVLYKRTVTTVGVRVNFLAAKTKVAPLKTLSVPLLVCVLLKKLYREVMSAISKRTKINNNICWTDSEVALCWIKGKEKMWKHWVENRVVGTR